MSYLNRHTKTELTFLMLSVVLVFFYVGLAAWANADLSAGRFALFMDERITFDGVRHILHPDGTIDFLLSVLHGGDHRYGRSLWNSIAIFSFLPERVWGEAGQIIADRMAQVVILTSTLVLLTITFAKHWAMRFLLLATLLATPYTEYFMVMPKPEPLQLLFLVAFLFFFKKNDMQLVGWYWILLGLAFGTKISTLPLVVIIIAAVLLKYRTAGESKKFISEITAALGFFLLGLAIAVPILLPHLVVSYFVFKLIKLLVASKNKTGQWTDGLIISALLSVNVVASAFYALKFKLKVPMAVWIKSTFLNTVHGSDSASINFVSWVDYLFTDWLIAPVMLTALLIGASLLLCMQYAHSYFQKTRQLSMPVIALLAGLALNIAIVLGVHRLWGHYLLPGTVLMVVGLFSIVELNLSRQGFTFNSSDIVTRLISYLSAATILMIIVITFLWWTPYAYSKYQENAHRTATVEYEKQYQSYLEITSFLAREANEKGRKLSVAFDAWLFIPISNAQYQITEFWGPFTEWKEKPDVIVMSERRRQGKDFPVGSPQYRDFMIEQEGFLKHVEDANHQCGEGVCYIQKVFLPIGGEILVMRNLKP